MGRQNVKTSVLMLTFNQERFISESIESVLMQGTSTPCELVIAEDCSLDCTRDVIRRYWEKYPNKIRVLLNRHNIKGRRTIARAYAACRGEYVAFLEGDDYWVHPDKLQRQADLLDRRPDCAMCFHSVTMAWDDGSQEPAVFRPRKVQDTYTLADLLEYNFIGACSTMYRKGLFDKHPAWFFLTPVGDWAQHVLHAQYGNIAYIDEPMGVYRQHSGGAFSTKDKVQKMRVAVEMLRHFLCVIPREYRGVANRSLCLSYCKLAWEYCDLGQYDEARRCMKECLREIRPGLSVPVWELLSTLVRARAPGLHRSCKRILGEAVR